MAFKIKKRGKLTYYYEGETPVLSSLVVEEQPDGDLKLYFAGLTGGYSAANILGRDEVEPGKAPSLTETIIRIEKKFPTK